jgi:cephalosporin hydroxylase
MLPPFPNDRALIDAMGADPEVRELRQRMLALMGKYKYAYNWTWWGRPIIQIPQDVMAMQTLLLATAPDVVVETGVAHGGSIVFIASMLELLGGDRRVVGVDVEIRSANRTAIEAHPMAKRITLIEGSSTAPDVVEQVRRHIGAGKKVLVSLDSNHTRDHVADELRAYAPLVSKGSYLVVWDTAIEDFPRSEFPDRPWGPGNSPMTAVHEFLKTNDDFEIDRELEARLLFTVSPDGFLKRVK